MKHPWTPNPSCVRGLGRVPHVPECEFVRARASPLVRATGLQWLLRRAFCACLRRQAVGFFGRTNPRSPGKPGGRGYHSLKEHKEVGRGTLFGSVPIFETNG